MQQSLPVYRNDKKLNISEQDIKNADRIIAQMIDNLQFFDHRLHGKPKMTDVHTHMGLFESYFKELSPLVKYDSVLTEELKTRNERVLPAAEAAEK